MTDPREADADKIPTDEVLQEPSTEKEPGEEPKDAEKAPEEAAADHHAVGIGVFDDANADTPGAGDASDDAPRSADPTPDVASLATSTAEAVAPPHPTAAETAEADSAPPTDAVSDEVRRDASGVEDPTSE